jgi:hypothetical protein
MKLFALALFLSMPLFGQEFAQETVCAIELPRATLDELAAVPLRQQAPRTIEQHRLPPLFGGRPAIPTVDRIVETGEAGSAALPDPPAAFVFVSDSSRELSPADPSGAVGPRHVVGAYNSGIVVHDRNGATLKKVTLAQFWFSNAAPGAFYDPRIVYDAQADRWIVMSILDERSVMLAVSESGDPAGAWRRYQIDERYADFSHLVLTAGSIVAATRYPAHSSIFFIVPRAEVYADPETLTAVRIATPDAAATPVASDSGDELMMVADGARISWRPIDGSAPWRSAAIPPDWTLPDRQLPQLGGAPLEGGSGSVDNAVERNGWIYAVMTRAASGDSHNSIVWCRVNRATGEAEWGSVTDRPVDFYDRPESYAYPSLAVNRSGAMLIGFGVFSSARHPSSGYVYRSPFGVTSSAGTIGSGDAAITFGDRWGDYTTTVVDPLDDASFWSLQMHAKKGRYWETSWAKVELPGGRRRASRH